MSSVYEGMTDAETQVSNHLREFDLWWVFKYPVFVLMKKESECAHPISASEIGARVYESLWF